LIHPNPIEYLKNQGSQGQHKHPEKEDSREYLSSSTTQISKVSAIL
jgi:hypothetical protein